MTIKQQGGVFGRNPTFNDVDVTDLTVGNDASVAGDASVSGELKVTGDAGFGASNPTKPVHVYSTSSLDHILIDGSVCNRSLGWATNGSARWNLYTTGGAESGSNAGSDLRLATYTDAGAYNGRVMDFYRNTKDVEITSGNLIIGASGKGIDFSAASGTGTSELFDDYEEGGWTPELTFGGGSTDITYTARPATYIKIGRMVFFTLGIQLSNKGTDTGNAQITGLPFTTISGSYRNSAAAMVPTTMTLTGTPLGLVNPDATTISLVETATTGRTNLTDTSFANNSYFWLTGTYFAV